MQRKLLKRFLELAGIAKERSISLGEKNDEITSFEDFVVNFMDDHPSDHVLLIVDENLDLALDDLSSQHSTISGSAMVQDIRHRLLPEQERQILALIRSANDSSHDIAIYNSPAHGFIAKAPMKKLSPVEVVAPLWEKHFAPATDSLSISSSTCETTMPSDASLSESSAGLDDLSDYIWSIDLIVSENRRESVRTLANYMGEATSI